MHAPASGAVPLPNSTSPEEDDVVSAQRYLGTFDGLQMQMERTPMLKMRVISNLVVGKIQDM
ncbi:hypothetical protein GH733_011831 [Mirounga leonina]|nr:hypothetical protein GH733_011831 [Mirounga leonina]